MSYAQNLKKCFENNISNNCKQNGICISTNCK